MPPKIIFTKEDILEAAFEVAKEKGLENLSARLVAKKLQASTAPVYSYFKSMDSLKNQIKDKAIELLINYQSQPYTEQLLYNWGVGFILFARDYKELFRSIFMGKEDFRGVNSQFLGLIRQEMDSDSELSVLSYEEKNRLLYNIWIFIYGFATLICVGSLENNNQEFIINSLIDVSTAIIKAFLEENRGAH